jgi:hypothetical protein
MLISFSNRFKCLIAVFNLRQVMINQGTIKVITCSDHTRIIACHKWKGRAYFNIFDLTNKNVERGLN